MIHLLINDRYSVCMTKPSLYSHKIELVDCDKCRLHANKENDKANIIRDEDIIEITQK